MADESTMQPRKTTLAEKLGFVKEKYKEASTAFHRHQEKSREKQIHKFESQKELLKAKAGVMQEQANIARLGRQIQPERSRGSDMFAGFGSVNVDSMIPSGFGSNKKQKKGKSKEWNPFQL
jgi:hypothetical protein